MSETELRINIIEGLSKELPNVLIIPLINITKEPPEINSERKKFSSAIGPKIKPNTKAIKGYLCLNMKYPTIAKNSTVTRSNGL